MRNLHDEEVRRDRLRHLQEGNENEAHHSNRYLTHQISRYVLMLIGIIAFILFLIFSGR